VSSAAALENYLKTNAEWPVASNPPPPSSDVLPGRAEQLRIALRLSGEDGPLTTLLGRGLGATRFKDGVDVFEGSVRKPGTPEDDVERTNGLWASRTLTEAGWLGIAAFAGLLAWLLVLSRRLWARAPERSVDRVIALAVPGVAGLTAAGAFYTTILSVQAYATVFWLVAGLALGARAQPANRAVSVPAQPDRPIGLKLTPAHGVFAADARVRPHRRRRQTRV
jgi:hypothetical protein